MLVIYDKNIHVVLGRMLNRNSLILSTYMYGFGFKDKTQKKLRDDNSNKNIEFFTKINTIDGMWCNKGRTKLINKNLIKFL